MTFEGGLIIAYILGKGSLIDGEISLQVILILVTYDLKFRPSPDTHKKPLYRRVRREATL